MRLSERELTDTLLTKILDLPTEVLMGIAIYFDIHTIFSLASTCKKWERFLNGYAADALWKQWCMQKGRKWKRKPAINFNERKEGRFQDFSEMSWREWFMTVWKEEVSHSRGKCVVSNWAGYNGNMGTMQVTDGKAVNALQDGSIIVWDVLEGTLLHTFIGHSAIITCLQAHSERTVSGSHDGTIRVWCLEKGILERTFTTNTCITSLKFDSWTLVAGDSHGTIWKWNIDSGEYLGVMKGHRCCVSALEFDHHFVVSSCQDEEIRIWNMNNGECLHTLHCELGPITSLHFNDSYIVAASTSGSIQLWSFKSFDDRPKFECQPFHSLTQSLILSGHSSWTTCVQLARSSPQDIPIVVSSSRDGTLRVWSCLNGECLRVLGEPSSATLAALEVFIPPERFKDSFNWPRFFTPAVIEWVTKYPSPIVISIALNGQMSFWSSETGEMIESFSTRESSALVVFSFSRGLYVPSRNHSWHCQPKLMDD